VELEIPIIAGDLSAAEERAFRRLVKNVRLAGFRKGKVPRKVFEQAYGSGAITHEAVEDVLPEAYARAVREHDLEPIERPKIEVVQEEEGRPTLVKATVAVRPEIVLREYKGVAVTIPRATVSDDDVERSLTALAKERATLVPVDRAAEPGDVVTIDYTGTIDGVPFEGGTATGESAELTEGRFIPGFVTGIVGMRPGETKDVRAHFPDNYAQPALAGKEAAFEVTVHDVKRYDLPAIDDAFATAVSGNASGAQSATQCSTRCCASTSLRCRPRWLTARSISSSTTPCRLPRKPAKRSNITSRASAKPKRNCGPRFAPKPKRASKRPCSWSRLPRLKASSQRRPTSQPKSKSWPGNTANRPSGYERPWEATCCR